MSEPTVQGVTTWTDGISNARVMVERVDAIGRIRVASGARNVDLLLHPSPLLKPEHARDMAARLIQMADELELIAAGPMLPGKLTDEDIERMR